MKFVDELCDGGCLGEVTELIAVLLLARLVIGNISEVGVPTMKNAWQRFRFKEVVSDKKNVPQWLKDYHMEPVELDGELS